MTATAAFRTRMIVCFAIIYIVWGSSYLATSVGVHHLPPFLFAGVRFTLAGLALIVIARARGERIAFDLDDLRQLLVMALAWVVISNGFNVWGLQWVASGQAALLNVTSSFWIAIFGMFGARGQPIDRRTAVGLALGFLGTLAIVWPRAGFSTAHLVPQFGILLGCMGWAAGTIYYRSVHTRLGILAFTGLQMCLGGLLMASLGLGLGEQREWAWNWPGMLAMGYLTVFSSCLAYAAYAWLTQHTTPARVATYGYVNPAIAALLGWRVLDEELSAVALGGMAVILAGVVLVNWPEEVSAPESPG
ncbi:MAG: putative inner membrane transporter YedA [Steroidobacteraceae bacterium]|nr:putative inner membrane transporter YedA [Steroidobacteraceae bacterium]